MAAIAGCLFHQNPRFFLDDRTGSIALSTSSALSKFHGLYLIPNSKSCAFRARFPCRSSIVSRFGGYRPPRESRRFRDDDDEFDSATDLSSIRLRYWYNGVEVILSPDADPPVLRIMDYKKYRYEQQKKKRGQQKKSAANRMNMKELKMGYNIDSHDYAVRLKAAQRFLKDGDKVKVIVNLKGRENEFRNIAIELIKRFQNDIGELATEESKNFTERNIYIILLPNRTVQQKPQEQPKKKDTSTAEVSARI